ncbi:MAG: sulfur carrier protein ThiS [Lacipirellulaceae bacterium]
MLLHVNGEPREAPDGTTVAGLLELLDVRVKHVAVERNLEVVPRADHAQTTLAEGDRLEVVTLVGGG